MKFLIFLMFFCLNAFANEIQISAKELIADEKKRLTHLKGGVEIKRLSDKLSAEEAYIFLDSNNRPTKMQAKGGVKFFFTLKDGRKIQGESQEALYFPRSKEYQILGNAVVREVEKNNVVRGDKIIIKQNEGFINVVGQENKPAKLIFKLEDFQ
ncbi:MAG: LptA/OstA family protein [Helicobacter sp.]|nr:LptA/OstA family protein [Helicobacteraceae bacterium]MDY3113609.1 LptA/OstA family protein [Helicobacter sp.]